MHRRAVTGLLLASLLGAVTGCGDSFDAKIQAHLRVANVSPDAGRMDVLVNDKATVTALDFGSISGYKTIEAATATISLNTAGTATALFQTQVPIQAGSDYTIIATNLKASMEGIVLVDDNSAPTAGNAKVRLVHAAPSAALIDLYLTGPNDDITAIAPTAASVAFKSVSAYLAVPAGAYRIRATAAGSKTVAIDSGTLNVGSGQIRTVIARDKEGGGPPYALLIAEDAN